jgi:hypothetical protein
MSKSHGNALFLKSTAIIAICLMFGSTNLMGGCVCFHPSVKEVPDTRPGKEGQRVVTHDELPWPCKVFWGSIWALSWLFPSDRVTSEGQSEKDAPGDYTRQETARLLDQFNRQYIEAGKHKKQR